MITLYRKNALGIGMWSIWPIDTGLMISHCSVIGGAAIQHEEVVSRGCQGRSLEQQIQHRMASRISKQKDKGYTESLAEAEKGAFNQLGLLPPMLAQVYAGQVGNRWIQRKLNGLRCLITRQDGELIAYSRRGKMMTAIQEVLEEAGQFVSEGQTIDGELYAHGYSLQTIQSWVKRRQDMTGKLVYAIYDQMSSDSFSDRHDELLDMTKGKDYKRCIILPKKPFGDEENRLSLFKDARGKGFEGLMIRLDGYGYESNKRSASLLKDKIILDTEVVVKDIVLSDQGNPVCIVVYDGKTFRVSPPGSKDERMVAYLNRTKYIGTLLTIEYRELTEDGIPFHAVGSSWRAE